MNIFKRKYLFLLVALLFTGGTAMAQGFTADDNSLIDSLQKIIIIMIGVMTCIVIVWQLVRSYQGYKTWKEAITNSLLFFCLSSSAVAAIWLFTTSSNPFRFLW